MADDTEEAESKLQHSFDNVSFSMLSSDSEVTNVAASFLKLMTALDRSDQLKPALADTAVLLIASRNLGKGRTLPDSFTDTLMPEAKRAVGILEPNTRACEQAEFPTTSGARFIVFAIDLDKATDFQLFMCTAIAIESPWVWEPSDQNTTSTMITNLFETITER